MNTRKDLLLEWASERGFGSWAQFREAYAWLERESEMAPWETASLVARQMSALGHIEVDWRRRSWAAAPPVLTLLPSAGAHALLTGGRTRELCDRLAMALADRDDLYGLDPVEQPLAPSAILIACEDERAMRKLASALGIESAYSVSSQLAEILPPLRAYLDLAGSTPAPRGYGVQALDLADLSWRDVEEDREPGLYRYQAPDGRRFRLVEATGSVFDVDLAIGAFAALAIAGETGRLKWFRASLNGELQVPLRTPLPTLHARALALCSGFAPERHGRSLVYLNVPEKVARAVAGSLAQDLQVVG
ncbi:MAG TPA: hypothetical protein VFU16_01855 [Solirubrobacterales bacterium]|nr:hypothetical protein [Solirubrobacterales bacterium]